MAGRSGFDYRQLRDMRIARRTILNRGTGVFIPLFDGVLASVFAVGGGGGGGMTLGGGGGGAAGASVALTIPLLFAAGPYAYIVGAGGVASTADNVGGGAGGATYFGGFAVPGGGGGSGSTTSTRTSGSAISDTVYGLSLRGGDSGGSYTSSADVARPMMMLYPTLVDPRYTPAVHSTSWYAGCGGSSPFGFGGSTTSASGVGYGAGGRGGRQSYLVAGPGGGGVIIILEYGE